MLREFLVTHRSELTDRCRSKLSSQRAPRRGFAELQDGIPLFLDRLIDLLPLGSDPRRSRPPDLPAVSRKALLGPELLPSGFTLDQAVLGYGELCLSIVELALERGAPITVEEFGALMTRLDHTLAASVNQHADREISRADDAALASNQCLRRLAHEMRDLLNTATLAISAIRAGNVGFGGSTAAALDRSLAAMGALLDRAMADEDLEDSATLHGEETARMI